MTVMQMNRVQEVVQARRQACVAAYALHTRQPVTRAGRALGDRRAGLPVRPMAVARFSRLGAPPAGPLPDTVSPEPSLTAWRLMGSSKLVSRG